MKKIACISILLLIAIGHKVTGYAKLAENMACVDEDCSEAVSQGKAKLAYQPRDSKFLKLKKGDVVLVKGKKAGLQTDLWGGQKFLGQNEEVEELTSLSSEGQKIVIEKKKPAAETVAVDSHQPDADGSPATKSEATTAETHEQTSTESSDNNAEIIIPQSETAEAPTPGILLKRLKHSIVQNGNDPHLSLKENTPSSDETENGEQSLDEEVEDQDMDSMKEEDKINSSDDVVDASEAESQDATPEDQSEQDSSNESVDVPESNHSQEISEHDKTESSKQEREPEAQQRDVADKVDNAELGAEAGDQQQTAEELQPKHAGEDFTSHSNNQAGSSTADKDSKSQLDEDKENSSISDDKHEKADEVSNTLSPDSQESNVPNKDSEETLDSTDTESEHPMSIVSSEDGGHENVAVDTTSSEQPTEGEHQSFDQKEENSTSPEQPTEGEHQSFDQKEDNSISPKQPTKGDHQSFDPKDENTTSPEQPTEGEHQSFDQKDENTTSPEQPTKGEHQSFDQKDENTTSPEQPTEGDHQSFDQNEENITSPEQPTEGDHQSFDQKGEKLDLENDALECMVAADRRVRCGVGKSTKTFCSALECCWQPNDNPAVPNCFFTRSQMTALKEKLLDDSASQAKQSDQDKPDDKQETYERLHEGKVVDWDESVEEKEKLKSSQWDESIGSDDHGNETTPFPHKEIEIATQQPVEESAKQETSSVDTISDVQASVEPVSDDDLSPFTEEAASTEPGSSETEGTAASDADNRPQDEERSESATDDGVSLEKVSEASVDKSQVEPSAVDEPRVQSQDDETKLEEDTKNDEESTVVVDETSIEDKDVDESTNLTQATETPAPSNNANEMHEVASKETDDADDVETEPIQSAAVKLLILFGQIPYDLAYVATPLARWWLALLPEDYQNDLFGVPWHIVLSTTIIGFVLLWFAVWRSGVSKQRQKQNHLINAASELKAQLETMMNEKLEKEKDLKNTQIELQQKLEHIEAEHEAMTKNQQEMQRLEQNVEQLKEEKDEKQNQLSQLLHQLETAKKEKERSLEEAKAKEKLLNERKVAQSDLETQVNQLKKEQKESLKQKKRVDDSLEEYRTRLKKEEKKNEEGSTASQKWKEKVNEMENLIKDLNDKLSEANKESTTQKQEVDVLKDCLLQFKGVQQSLVEDGDEDELDSEELIAKQKDKLKDLIDVSAIQQRLKLIETHKGRLKFELEAEKKSREETEERVGELEAACENERSLKSKTERDLQLLQAKLNVMQEFYAKREVEMQGKLGKEQTVKEMQQSRLAEQDDKTHDLIEKIEMYKRMNDEAKKEYEEAEKQRKGEISQFEKKAHANWLASREAERKLDEANREINHLRMDVTDYQHRLRELESRDSFLVRPRPVLPHGAPFPPGPRFGPMRHSPLPMRNGPNERSSPPPRSRRGGQSPTGSLHDEVRHPSRPDRPPSIQSHPDRRPPSQGPFAPPDLIGPPPPLPMQFGLQAGDGIPRPPLRGPIPFREGPLPMRDIPPPMRDGPMPPRDCMPPMRDGAPPRMRRPGSAGGPLTSSPYMDRPAIPSSQSPLRPPPPRGSHPASSLHSHGPLPERPPGRPTNPYRS